jgi:hypothetical protein
MKIPTSILQLVCLLAWFATLALSSRCQVPTPPRFSHRPRTLPLTKFYDAPTPLPAGKPGELIRFESVGEYDLSYEVLAVRILYHSRSASGADVAVSGVVLLPDGRPPPGGWPVIAWAHDFTGSARQCAPSLLRNLNQGPLLSMYVGLGYAVVASDYAGLGTNFPNATFDLRSNALDLLFAIPAARAALPQLGTRWVAVGYSEGALAAVGVAEAGGELADSNYLGGVAISGVADAQEMFERVARGSDQRVFVQLAHGIKTIFPDFRVNEMLTDKAVPLYQHLSQACDASFEPGISSNDLLQAGWENNRHVKEFFARNILGLTPAHGPLLMISGDADPEIPSALTAKVVTRLCGQKDRAVFVKYPGLNATAILENSVSEQISWIKARFAGHTAPTNCP